MPNVAVMVLVRADTLEPLHTAIRCLPTHIGGRYIPAGRILIDQDPVHLSFT